MYSSHLIHTLEMSTWECVWSLDQLSSTAIRVATSGGQRAHLCEDVIDEGVIEPAQIVEQVRKTEALAHHVAILERPTGLLLGYAKVLVAQRMLGPGQPRHNSRWRVDQLSQAVSLPGPVAQEGFETGARLVPALQLLAVGVPTLSSHRPRWVDLVEGCPNAPFHLLDRWEAGIDVHLFGLEVRK